MVWRSDEAMGRRPVFSRDRLWLGEVLLSTLRFLVAPNRRATWVVTALFYVLFVVAYWDDLRFVAEVARDLVLGYPFLFAAGALVLLIPYVPAQHVLALELLILWLRLLHAPLPPSEVARRRTFVQRTSDDACSLAWTTAKSAVSSIGVERSRQAWSCARRELGLDTLRSDPDAVLAPRVALTVLLTVATVLLVSSTPSAAPPSSARDPPPLVRQLWRRTGGGGGARSGA